MTSRNLFSVTAVPAVLILFFLAAPVSVSASYAGDRPPETVFHENISGGYLFSAGNSTYSGPLTPGDRYTATFDMSLPTGAEIIYERVYVYWAWSKCGQKAVYPSMQIVRHSKNQSSLSCADRYVDNKGVRGSNDFFSGMDACSGADLKSGDNLFSVQIENTGTNNSGFVIQGIGVLGVYADESGKRGQIWVSEGCDMLYAGFGISPEMATSRISFPGRINTGAVRGADLFLVAPSGGYTRSDIDGKNMLSFNHNGKDSLPSFIEMIIRSLFPGYNGKQWSDVFVSDDIHQIGTDIRDVKAYLRPDGNYAEIRDSGDYLLLTNAVLMVETKEGST
ncbi:MAG: DUF3344 domain-containing protein [Euryarchaeota archaeon]|nr:DUF3344 domain-containing protein [Euryarchaeota archaeon]